MSLLPGSSYTVVQVTFLPDSSQKCQHERQAAGELLPDFSFHKHSEGLCNQTEGKQKQMNFGSITSLTDHSQV